jgi:uncharacterized protein with FMN-binding domain
MRRIALWIATTVTIVVLLFGYHTSTNSTAIPPTTASTSQPSSSSPSPSPPSPPPPSPSPPGSPSSSSSAASSSETFKGSVAQTRWGPVQVQITTKDGKVTAVDVIEYPTQNPRDVEINDQALPVLVAETLEAQSAEIDMVSGATVTSEGYLQSLQAALDEAGI